MHYDAIQEELESNGCNLMVEHDPPFGFVASILWHSGDITTGSNQDTLPDALHSLNQALKEEQEKNV